MSTKPELVTAPFPTPAERIRKLQEEIDATVGEATTSLRNHLFSAAMMAEECQSFPLPAGEKEEYRQIGEAIRSSLERLTALDGRR